MLNKSYNGYVLVGNGLLFTRIINKEKNIQLHNIHRIKRTKTICGYFFVKIYGCNHYIRICNPEPSCCEQKLIRYAVRKNNQKIQKRRKKIDQSLDCAYNESVGGLINLTNIPRG